jgi:hypothetical protein
MSDLIVADEATEIGWQVIDPDGNVVSSGPVTIAQLVALSEQE